MARDLFTDIDRFNEIYKLPRPPHPKLRSKDALIHFKSIISEEVDEVDEIIDNYKEDPITLVALGDWLGDLIVYCLTFARSYGLPMHEILKVIMDSNFSKLDSDGNPIYDQRGKVMKGPDFIAPEPMIKAIIERDFK